MITLALPWTITIRTADGPYVSLDVGNVNTSEDALATVQAITALLSFPSNKDTRAWLMQRFSREWLAPLLELAQEFPCLLGGHPRPYGASLPHRSKPRCIPHRSRRVGCRESS